MTTLAFPHDEDLGYMLSGVSEALASCTPDNTDPDPFDLGHAGTVLYDPHSRDGLDPLVDALQPPMFAGPRIAGIEMVPMVLVDVDDHTLARTAAAVDMLEHPNVTDHLIDNYPNVANQDAAIAAQILRHRPNPADIRQLGGHGHLVAGVELHGPQADAYQRLIAAFVAVWKPHDPLTQWAMLGKHHTS